MGCYLPKWAHVVALLERRHPCLRLPVFPNGYIELLGEIASRIARSQTWAALAVSRELVLLYWSVGAEILLRQKAQGWGSKVIDRLGRALPRSRGFQPAKSEVHAFPGRGLARPRNSATACGTIALGTRPTPAEPGKRPGRPRLVPGRGGPGRLEPRGLSAT